MAVSAQTPLIDYVASGSTADFIFPFLVIEEPHLKVFVNGELTTSGYVLAGLGNPSGGTLTFLSTPVAGTRVVLARQVPLARTTDYIEGGPLRADVLDADFDNVVRMIQDIRADAITVTTFQTLADQIEVDRAEAEAAAATAIASASSATASAAAALGSQTAAATSQTSASTSASTATAQAGIATTQAGIATAQATTASTQAGIATSQASSASASASTATSQAGIATTQAGIATTQASNASTSASAAAASAAFAANLVPRTGTTGSAVMPVGTSAQRDGSPANGYTRFNTTLQSLEVYNSTAAAWVPAGQGATGAVGNPVFYENDKTVTGDYTIAGTKNALSAGPITINTGVTVTVSTGATWSIV